MVRFGGWFSVLAYLRFQPIGLFPKCGSPNILLKLTRLRSGFYIGPNGGGGWSHKCWDISDDVGLLISPLAAQGCHDASGGLVGGQIGYRWQASSWVFGLEAQGDWANLRGSNTSLFFPGIRNQSKIDAIGLFTVRLAMPGTTPCFT